MDKGKEKGRKACRTTGKRSKGRQKWRETLAIARRRKNEMLNNQGDPGVFPRNMADDQDIAVQVPIDREPEADVLPPPDQPLIHPEPAQFIEPPIQSQSPPASPPTGAMNSPQMPILSIRSSPTTTKSSCSPLCPHLLSHHHYLDQTGGAAPHIHLGGKKGEIS